MSTLFFYRYREGNHNKQVSFEDLFDAVKCSLQHIEEDPTIKNPVIVDAAGNAKFAPRTIR